MAEFLSQDEIDALLDIAEQGEILITNLLKGLFQKKIILFMILKTK